MSLKIPKDISENSEDQYIIDLNQDKRPDFLSFARDKNSKDVFTQILIYINHKNEKNEDILLERYKQKILIMTAFPILVLLHLILTFWTRLKQLLRKV